MPTISPHTKNIELPYHLFRSKVKAIEIKFFSINNNDQLEDHFTKGLQEGKFELAWKNGIKW